MTKINKMKKNAKKKAYGLIDTIVNKMPEVHLASYQFCGPGTKLEKRLARGDPGINELDVACKEHDLAYATVEDSKGRRKADKILINQALKRVFSKDAKLGERAAALLVSAVMGAKRGLTKIGLGLRGKNIHKKKKRSSKQKSIAFRELVRGAKDSIETTKANDSLNGSIIAAIRHAKHIKRGKTVKIPRVLKLPKFGGKVHRYLSLDFQKIVPLLSGLSAIGSITASAVGVLKAVKDIDIAKKQLMNENYSSEKKIGRALSLVYKTGKNARGTGFYLKPYHQQQR